MKITYEIGGIKYDQNLLSKVEKVNDFLSFF